MGRAPAIRCRDLAFQPAGPTGPTALAHLQLDLGPARTLLVAGPSGCGKSTFLDLVAGLGHRFPHPRVRGQLFVDWPHQAGPADAHQGHPQAAASRAQLPLPAAGRVGYLQQHAGDGLLGFDVRTALSMPLEQQRLPATNIRQHVQEALATLGLESLAGRETSSLSTGERKAVAIAGIVALDPPLVLLDEPLAHLDAARRAWMLERIAQLQESDDPPTIVIAEHRIAEVEHLVDDVLQIVPAGERPPDTSMFDQRQSAAKAEAHPTTEPNTNGPPADGMASSRPGVQEFAPRPWTTSVVQGATNRAPIVLAALTIHRGGKRLLHATTQEFEPGIHGIRGANGVGKTTLLETIAGLRRPSAGRVLIDGQPVAWKRSGFGRDGRAMPERRLRRTLQLAFPDPRDGWTEDTVADELAAPLETLGLLGRPRARSQAHNALAAWGLEDLASRAPGTLSGGQIMRTQMLGHLLVGPRVWLIDEPGHGLGGEHRRLVRDTLDRFADAGGTALVVSHDRDIVPDQATWWRMDGNGSLHPELEEVHLT